MNDFVKTGTRQNSVHGQCLDDDAFMIGTHDQYLFFVLEILKPGGFRRIFTVIFKEGCAENIQVSPEFVVDCVGLRPLSGPPITPQCKNCSWRALALALSASDFLK